MASRETVAIIRLLPYMQTAQSVFPELYSWVYSSSMLTKKLNELEESDIQQLISLQIREGKTIEYKKELSIATDLQKKEFLADVSSFANTAGGDLLFGVEAKGGIPTALSPLSIDDIDAEILRIESIIRTGIDPRFSFTVHAVSTAKPKEYVLVIRVHESWNKPHRIIYSGSGKFHARSSAGKYELDVEELRQIFTLSDGIEKRMRDFRAERLIAVETGDTTLPLTSNNLIVIHLLPLESFSTRLTLTQDTLLSLEKETELLRPIFTSNWHSPRINLEGMYSFSGVADEFAHSYIQVFRSGAIEVVESSILDRADGNIMPGKVYESYTLEGIRRGLEITKKVAVNTPVLVCVSLLNVRGVEMNYRDTTSSGTTIRRGRFDHEHAIRQKDLILPGVLIGDYDDNVDKLMKPALDLVWNACGIPGSQFYDKDGNFLIKR